MNNPTLSRRDLLQLSALAAISPPRMRASGTPKPSQSRPAHPEQSGGTPEDRLSTRGLFMHAWDLRDDGADRVMGWMRDSGLNLMCIAGCYHSGWFVHPHNPKHRL